MRPSGVATPFGARDIRRLSLLPHLLLVGIALLVAAPGFVIVVNWLDEFLDALGILFVLGGTLLAVRALAAGAASKRRPLSLWTGLLAITAGVNFIVNAWGFGLGWTLVLCSPLGLDLLGAGSWLLKPWDPRWRQLRAELRQCVREKPLALVNAAALAILLEMGQDALAKGGPKHHALELGLYGLMLTVLALYWTASADGPAALDLRGPLPGGSTTALGWRRFRTTLILMALFLALMATVRAPAIESADSALVHQVYRCAGPSVTQSIRKISNAGGENMLVLWTPFVLVLVALFRRRSVRLFLSTLLGTLALETIFKALAHRARPDLVHHRNLDSFPSGHALAAAVLAGVLITIFLPLCRRRWQRVLLCVGASLWPVVTAIARVYLGRHYLTDVLGGMLLGAAWVCFCQALILLLSQPSPATVTDREPVGATP